ncbi:hypothetical protein C2845_PM08G26480 [Panicum miliaceum]|uniref:Uncharacterized protein n=1 Tax=Panicum miliaceum TaxID=4540 RepID=A0A3L6R1R4_PANMI|nr:hypothetical protein C2845_PM08G26480 [Panicum miliaceum]
MVEHAGKGVLQPSMSSCLPLLVFQHRSVQNADADDEMLMFSLSQQSLHQNLEHGLLAAGNAMFWATPQGWMLLAKEHDASSPPCLWNPRTGDRLRSPPGHRG